MHVFKLLPGLRTLSLLGALSLTFTGCMTQEEKAEGYDSDGQSAFLVTELDQMGQSLGQMPEASLGKAASSRDVVIKGELVIEPFSYQEDCRCFVRRARFTGQEGYERVRVDSVTLLDSAGEPMDAFRPARVAKVIYRRDVDREKGAREVHVRIDVTVDIRNEGASRVGVWNGTMSGAFDGQEFKSGTVANVLRPFEDGRFRFPESGIIDLTRPVFHYKVEFLGEGEAKVTVRNHLNGRIHVLWVDADYKESQPAAE